MNLEDKRALLQSMRVVNGHLQNDIVQIEHKVLQTNNDIARLDEIVEDLKQRKDDVLFDNNESFMTVEALSECILHLSIAVTEQNQKSSILQMVMGNIRDIITELNKFANALPEIFTDD